MYLSILYRILVLRWVALRVFFEELKRRRRDLSLELEMRDYVTLASMKEKEADWWGQAARNAAAYDAETQSMAATWKAAPEDCAPLRLRIYGYAGRVWHVLKACCFRGCSFDVIDAPKLLCEGVGILGMSTWFDVLLKPVPHSRSVGVNGPLAACFGL